MPSAPVTLKPADEQADTLVVLRNPLAMKRLLDRAWDLGIEDARRALDSGDLLRGEEIAAILLGTGLTPRIHALLRNIYRGAIAHAQGTLFDREARR